MENFVTAKILLSHAHCYIDIHTKPTTNVTEKLQPYVSNHHAPSPSKPSLTILLFVMSSLQHQAFTFGVMIKTDAPLHGLEELESLATKGQVHRLVQSPHTLLFIEPELLQSPQFSLHKKSPSDRPARSGRLHIQWGIMSHLSTLQVRLQVSECRKTLFPWRQLERLGRGGPFLTGHSGSVNLLHVLLPTRHECVAKCDTLSSRSNRGRTPRKKWFFLKNYYVFLQAFFTMSLQIPENILEEVWGRNATFHFLTDMYFSPGRYLDLDLIYSLFFSFLFFWKLIIGANIFFSATVLAYPQPVLPSLPTVTVSGRNSVTIETPSLSGGDVSSFTSWEIQWRPIGGEWQTATIPTSSSSYTIPGELAGGVYDIRVRATSASGNSLYTWPVQILLSALPTVRKYC